MGPGLQIVQGSGSTNGKSNGSPQQNKEEIDDENHNTANE
jgi:hypothetical protein